MTQAAEHSPRRLAEKPGASAAPSPAHNRPDAIRAAFTNSNLMNRAKAKVEQKLAADPADAQALRQLGDLLRKLGDFDAALETYRKLSAVEDEAMAAWGAWAIGALNGEQLPPAPTEPHPTPFVRLTGFLTAAQQDMLLNAVSKGPEHFAPARVSDTVKGRVDLDSRVAWVAKPSVRRQIRPWFVKELGRVASDVVRHFNVGSGDDMNKYRVELEVTAHRSGDFFVPHRDNGYARSDSRMVSFAYYFHREPKDFSGGDLLLYDTCIAAGDCRLAAFSRIEPTNNSLVFFPSAYYHEVLPVLAKGDAFGNARFTVNGWLHRAGI